MPRPVPRIVLLTGMAGAGKTTAVRAFEDLGYFCVDNLPVELLHTFLGLLDRGDEPLKVALVMDARERDFGRRWPGALESAARAGYRLEVVFLEASDATLLRRFSETRRRHPLGGDLAGAIARERQMLAELKKRADLVLDTNESNVHQLKAAIVRDFGTPGKDGQLQVSVISFGYRYGTPREADLLLDVRFLPNPNFIPGLKPKTGLHPKVSAMVLRSRDGITFLKRLGSLLDFLLPRYRKEGKAYLTIGVGCTGGRHRSVAMAEAIAKRLKGKGLTVGVLHRDIDRESP